MWKPHVATSVVPFDDAIEVRGRVVDSVTREPVYGALIEDVSRSNPDPPRTKDDGTFEARIRSSTDGCFDIGIFADLYCGIHRTWSREELERSLPLEIALPRTAGIEGVLRDSKGNPVADRPVMVGPDPFALQKGQGSTEDVPAALQALLDSWSLHPSQYASRYRTTRTDASGRFAVDDLVPWTPAIHIGWCPNGGCVPTFTLSGGPLGGPGDWTRVESKPNVVEVGAVRGRLLLNGRPISGAVDWEGPTRRGAGAAARDGSFHLDAVEVGEVTISTRRSTEDPNRLGFAQSCSVEVTAKSTLDRDFDLVMPMSSISGHVRTEIGTPVADQELQLSVLDGSLRGCNLRTKTGPDGAWSIAVPVDSSSCIVSLLNVPIPVRRDTLAAGSVDVDLVQPEITTDKLRVLVVDSSTGQPVDDPMFVWRRTGTVSGNTVPIVGANSDEAPTVRRLGRHLWDFRIDPSLRFTKAGWFTLECPTGSIDLLVQAAGYPSVLRRDVEIGGVDEPRRIEVPLEKGVGVGIRLAPDSGPLPYKGLWIAILDEDELQAVRGSDDPDVRSITRDELFDALGGMLDERSVRLGPGDAVRMGRLRKGHYRLAILDKAGTIEPDAIDVGQEGETFAIRWTPK